MRKASNDEAPSRPLQGPPRTLFASRPFLLELFALANAAVLALDAYLAHSSDRFVYWAEWIPVVFAGAATVSLAVTAVQTYRHRTFQGHWRGYVIGWTAIGLGMGGFLWHLNGWRAESVSLRSLGNVAPFVAPLSFAGLGCLLLLNRMEDPASPAWGRRIVLLAWGGFAGTFALSLIDHAQNGFLSWTEGIPIVTSALAVGSLGGVVLRPPTRRTLLLGAAVLGLQVVTGVVGTVLHQTLTRGPSALQMGVRASLRAGPPTFAPLLFVDLGVLGALGLWDLHAKMGGGA